MNVPPDSQLAGKHTKGQLSVDTNLAQNYAGHERLPRLKETSGNSERPESEWVEVILDEELPEIPEPEEYVRDKVTGRPLAYQGRTCLRCVEKDLRCTLTFVGKELEIQCAACRRSKAPLCVRFRPAASSSKDMTFNGPVWKNPYFVAGEPDGRMAPRDSVETALREFYDGRSKYVMGKYVSHWEAGDWGLPPFNGSDLPPGERPEKYEDLTWRDVLPYWRNESLRPRRTARIDYGEDTGKKLALAREKAKLPPNPNPVDREEVEADKGGKTPASAASFVQTEDEYHKASLLRVTRKYDPRDKNINDLLGETW
ncbi:hypothetical protein GGR51DRAFT_560286 [Nemania sp. FL0031]|nr:hypothetical protein GGR51DRAFT_560286 [Nemania sp. FL0031]